MRRLAAGTGVTGLGLMSFATLLTCKSSALGLESKVLLFLLGIALLVVGGSGYAATER